MPLDTQKVGYLQQVGQPQDLKTIGTSFQQVVNAQRPSLQITTIEKDRFTPAEAEQIHALLSALRQNLDALEKNFKEYKHQQHMDSGWNSWRHSAEMRIFGSPSDQADRIDGNLNAARGQLAEADRKRLNPVKLSEAVQSAYSSLPNSAALESDRDDKCTFFNLCDWAVSDDFISKLKTINGTTQILKAGIADVIDKMPKQNAAVAKRED